MSEIQPQFNQLQEQHSQGFGKSEEVPATVLVERSDGSIDTGHVFSGGGIDGRTAVYLEPNEEFENGYAAHKVIETKSLSDKHQQELASKLAGLALRGDPDEERFDAMFGEDNANRTPEDAAMRTESNDQRLQRERRMADERDAAMKRIGRPEMN